MLNKPAIFLVWLSLLLGSHETGRAEPAQDRIAIMLSGPDCPALRNTVTAALQQQTGVLHVDADLMPGHVLIDIVRQHLTEAELIAVAKKASGEGHCKAEVMRSCISTDLASQLPSKQP